jgi:hypothetical protein
VVTSSRKRAKGSLSKHARQVRSASSAVVGAV